MKANEFKQLNVSELKDPILQALWYDGHGNWQFAHEIVADLNDKRAARIHAYLHRKEGDLWNADYWYRNADKLRPTYTIEEEWAKLVEEFYSTVTSQ